MDILSQHLIEVAKIPQDTLIALLMLPVVATLVVLSRHILGIKSFGIYFPIIVTYGFIELGIEIGLLLVIFLGLVGILTRMSISILRIHYLSRLSLVICISTLASIVFLYSLYLLGFDTGKIYSSTTGLPVILIISFCETFVSTQIQKGLRTAMYLFFETIIISVLGYLLINWTIMREFVLDFPYIIIATVLINILIGKWTGIRLLEIWRFRTIKKK